MSTKKLRLFCAVTIVVIAAVGPANAQSTLSRDNQSTLSRDEMDALKAQINALQQEVRELRGKVNKAEQTAQKAYAANPPPPKAAPPAPTAPTAVAKMTPSNRPSVCAIEGIAEVWTKTGTPYIDNLNCIVITSRLHVDVGGYDYRPNIGYGLTTHPAFYGKTSTAASMRAAPASA